MSAKQKIVHGHGPSIINLEIFVCSFDVCQAQITGRYILQSAGCMLKFNYNWKTAGTKNN